MTWSQREPKGNRKGAKGSKRGPKGNQKGNQSELSGSKRGRQRTKERSKRRNEEKGGEHLLLGIVFGSNKLKHLSNHHSTSHQERSLLPQNKINPSKTNFTTMNHLFKSMLEKVLLEL